MLTDNRESIAGICPQPGVQRLGVFGSAVRFSFAARPWDRGDCCWPRYLPKRGGKPRAWLIRQTRP